MQIESYRTRLEEFEQTLNREVYRYRSGNKSRFELVSLYADYSDLFCIESIREVESALKTEPFESRRKSLEKIVRFLMDQHLDLGAAALREEICRAEADRTVLWGAREIPVSQLPRILRTEPDAFKRRKLHELCGKAFEETEELELRRIAKLRASAAGMGFENFFQASERISGIDYQKLLNSFEEALAGIEDKYIERFRFSVETSLGIPFHEAGFWDVAHWEHKNDQPRVFSERDLAGVVETTVSELGIRPERNDAVSMDLGGKARSKASCVPIRIPQEIKIILSPEGGFRDYSCLLHETGHGYHFAWTSSSLPPEHRMVGDRAVCEAYAFLLEHFLQDREWLARMLLFSKSGSFLAFQALHRIFQIRRQAGKLSFSIQLHRLESLDEIPQIYSETMKRHTGLRYSPEWWSADSGDGFVSANYLRGWTLEAMLREYLRVKFGSGWSSSRAASNFLKEIWETGLLYSADELCREIGMGELEPHLLAAQLREGLQL